MDDQARTTDDNVEATRHDDGTKTGSDPDSRADGPDETAASNVDPEATVLKPADAVDEQELDAFAETLVREQQNLDETLPETSLRPRSTGSNIGIESVSVGSRRIQSAKEQTRERGLTDQASAVDGLDYLTIDLLGEGGMGTVHLARQVALGREVALKQIRREHQQQGSAQDEFLTEAVLTGKLEHPNIVPVYEVGKSPDGDLFYSMKNVRGRAWSDTIGTLSLQDNLDILINVCDAIAFAHAEGVIHRDLKPQNIMTGGFGEVLVLDWGLAIVMGTDSQANASIAGTPAYMAPEMVNAPESAGPRSDVYLLGAILFRILTGKAPHRGRTGRDCVLAAASNEIETPDEDRLAGIDPSGELLQVALRAMATDPNDRFATAPEFQQAVRDFLLHRDSLELSSRAETSLEAARENDDYAQFSRAVFGFEEATKLWEENEHATEGADEARLAWAQSAEHQGDFDLCLSLIDELRTDQTELRDRVTAARDERESRQHRIRRLRYISMATSLAVAVVASIAAVWINSERTKAIIAKQDEATQRSIAEHNEREARKQKQAAVAARLLAEQREDEARRARKLAEDNAREAEKQTQIALSNAEVAREQTDVAVRTLGAVIFDLQRGLRSVPNGGALRHKLLNTALDRLADISTEFSRDGMVDHHQAAALVDLADVFLEVGSESEKEQNASGRSRLDVAHDLLKQALSISRQLADAHPENVKAQIEYASVLSRLGSLSLQRQEISTASDYYQQGHELLRSCVTKEPDNNRLLRSLSISLGNLGSIQSRTGRKARAFELFKETYNVQKKLADLNPEDQRAQRDLAVCLTSLGGVAWDMRRLQDAYEYRRQGLQIFEQLASKSPADIALQHDVASSLSNVAWVAISLGRQKEAQTLYLRSLEIFRKLASDDPLNFEAQRALTNPFNGLGRIHLNQENWDDALSYYRQGIEVHKRLLAAEPDNIETQDDLAGWYAKAASASRFAGNLKQAASYYLETIAIRKQMAESNPRSPELQIRLADYYGWLGGVRLQQKHFSDALDCFNERLAIVSTQSRTDSEDPSAHFSVIDCQRQIGDVHLQQSQLIEAEKRYREALALGLELSEQHPGDARAERRVAQAWSDLSEVSLQRGDTDEAVNFRGKELDVRRKLSAKDSENYSRLLKVFQSLQQLGIICHQGQRLAQASTFFREALATRKQLSAMTPDSINDRRNIMVSHYELGDVYRDASDFENAIDQYQAGISLLDELISNGHLVDQASRDRGVLTRRIASVRLRMESTGDWAEVLLQAKQNSTILYYRAREFAAQGRLDEAAQAAAKLRELAAGNPDELYNAACAWCRCAATIQSTDDAPLTKEDKARRIEFRDQALACLKQAFAAGYDDIEHAEKDLDLVPLRDLPEFNELMNSSKKKQEGSQQADTAP